MKVDIACIIGLTFGAWNRLALILGSPWSKKDEEEQGGWLIFDQCFHYMNSNVWVFPSLKPTKLLKNISDFNSGKQQT